MQDVGPNQTNRVHLAGFSIVFALVSLLACLLIITSNPSQAYAKSYEMPSVDIEAEVLDNGDLEVHEIRTFSFDGSFSAIWWSFTNLPGGAKLEIEGVTMQKDGVTTKLSSVPFQAKWRDAGGPEHDAYSFDGADNTVYAFFDADDQTVTFTIDYLVKDAVQVYKDTSELYWQFVGSDWAENSDDVSLTLTLPVAQGERIIKGENVRAWGHGPLDAELVIDEQQQIITCYVPQVSAGQYAEIRVTFPTSWEFGVSATDSNASPTVERLDSIITEEQQWADQANTQRMSALVALIVVVLLCILLCVWAIRSFVKYGKELKPTFTDKYWRDVPAPGEHPAVIGRIMRFDREDNDDLTATIMHLVNQGAILINKGSYEKPGRFGGSKNVEDYYLTRAPGYESKLNNEVDRLAFEFLFDTVGEGSNAIWMTSIQAYAKAYPNNFVEAVQSWQGEVSARVINGNYFEAYSKAKQTQMRAIASVFLVAIIVIALVMSNLLLLIPGVITIVVLFVVAHFMDRRTQKGADVYAKAEGLKNWLTDFSLLKERPPLDIKVWGEYLVYAYIFGIADKVIDELRNTVPELFVTDAAMNDSYYVPWWYLYMSTPRGSALPSVSQAFSSSLAASIAEVSSSAEGNFSSGGGFGGGFSGGGGGGFGGGGGAR